MRRALGAAVLGGVMLAAGCATPQRATEPEAERRPRAADERDEPAVGQVPVSMRHEARAVTVLRGDGSGTASWDEAVADMARADVVLMGEVHGHELGNRVQQELFEDILVRQPDAVLSMEFYERDDQVALDDYLSGVTDRTAFEAAADRGGSNNPWAHARMIDAAREAGRPVIAANAPRRYVRLARTDGYERLEALGERQRALLAIPEGTPTGAYRDRFVEAMGGMASHGGEEMIEGFLRSQSVWDATMAQSIVDALRLGDPVVHVVGFFHVEFGGEDGGSGLIDQIRERSDRELDIVTLITLPTDDQGLREEDVGIAEYVVYVVETGRQ